MDETANKPQSPRTEGGETLKPYQQPKLTPLGSIHSLVRATPGVGMDMGGVGTNSFS